jgi:hypothetical protein
MEGTTFPIVYMYRRTIPHQRRFLKLFYLISFSLYLAFSVLKWIVSQENSRLVKQKVTTGFNWGTGSGLTFLDNLIVTMQYL